jgi:hypothetical protein
VIAAPAALGGTITSVAHPVGDFGRPRPGTPAYEALHVRPVSELNFTDEEREMHDRVWRFLTAPYADPWFFEIVVSLNDSTISRRLDPDRYYKWLRTTEFRSSRVRYATVGDHARSDVDTVPTTFAAICRALEVDRQRGVASFELGGLEAKEVAARQAENRRFIGWFTLALRYRFEAYNNALNHLLVETPHREAVEVDRQLGYLQVYVDRAESGDFCSNGLYLEGRDGEAIPSRVLMGDPDEGAYRK